MLSVCALMRPALGRKAIVRSIFANMTGTYFFVGALFANCVIASRFASIREAVMNNSFR